MWTYFTIFFSLVMVVGVFGHRIIVNRKSRVSEAVGVAGQAGHVSRQAGVAEKVVEEEVEEEEKILLSKDEKAETESLCKRGESLIAAGKDEEAIKCFVQALTINSQHLETQQRLALLYLQKQMYSAAAALFRQLAAQTSDPIHYSHLGLALYQQSDFENAKVAYQTAVDMDPSRPQRFVSLGQVYKALGQLANAIIAVNKAVEADEKNLEFLYMLADLQVESGNYVAAKETLGRLLVLDTENRAAKDLLKEIKRLEGEL